MKNDGETSLNEFILTVVIIELIFGLIYFFRGSLIREMAFNQYYIVIYTMVIVLACALMYFLNHDLTVSTIYVILSKGSAIFLASVVNSQFTPKTPIWMTGNISVYYSIVFFVLLVASIMYFKYTDFDQKSSLLATACITSSFVATTWYISSEAIMKSFQMIIP